MLSLAGQVKLTASVSRHRWRVKPWSLTGPGRTRRTGASGVSAGLVLDRSPTAGKGCRAALLERIFPAPSIPPQRVAQRPCPEPAVRSHLHVPCRDGRGGGARRGGGDARPALPSGAGSAWSSPPRRARREMLAALVAEPGIDWRRVTAFHMDEYIGLPPGAPQRFGAWLGTRLFDRVPFGEVHLIEPGDDPARGGRRLRRPAGGGADRHRLPRHRRQRPPRLQRPAGRRLPRSPRRQDRRARRRSAASSRSTTAASRASTRSRSARSR